MIDYVLCPLNEVQRSKLRKQIDSGQWKHSWHLPTNANGDTDWNNLETVTKIRDVLLDQITEAKAQLRDAEKCLTICVNSLIEMEKQVEVIRSEQS